jgi:hypothetical protein
VDVDDRVRVFGEVDCWFKGFRGDVADFFASSAESGSDAASVASEW